MPLTMSIAPFTCERNYRPWSCYYRFSAEDIWTTRMKSHKSLLLFVLLANPFIVVSPIFQTSLISAKRGSLCPTVFHLTRLTVWINLPTTHRKRARRDKSGR